MKVVDDRDYIVLARFEPRDSSWVELEVEGEPEARLRVRIPRGIIKRVGAIVREDNLTITRKETK